MSKRSQALKRKIGPGEKEHSSSSKRGWRSTSVKLATDGTETTSIYRRKLTTNVELQQARAETPAARTRIEALLRQAKLGKGTCREHRKNYTKKHSSREMTL
jgi:hypothetical protein